MENYKIKLFDDVTYQSKGVKETEIPLALVEAIQTALNNLPDVEGEGWHVTPAMTNPNLKEISVGLLTKTTPTVFKFVVSVKTKEYWDDIYNRLKTVKDEKDGNDSLCAAPDNAL
jgi:hypothetical protein